MDTIKCKYVDGKFYGYVGKIIGADKDGYMEFADYGDYIAWVK